LTKKSTLNRTEIVRNHGNSVQLHTHNPEMSLP
jgi:hypothetical protein